MRQYNTITRKKAEELIQHNTVGKGKNDPSHTAVANARYWIKCMDEYNSNELNIYCGDK